MQNTKQKYDLCKDQEIKQSILMKQKEVRSEGCLRKTVQEALTLPCLSETGLLCVSFMSCWMQ